MKLSEQAANAIDNFNSRQAQGLSVEGERFWISHLPSRIAELEAASELLHGLIEMMQICNQLHILIHRKGWDIVEIHSTDQTTYAMNADTPRAALEAAVAKFKEQNK